MPRPILDPERLFHLKAGCKYQIERGGCMRLGTNQAEDIQALIAFYEANPPGPGVSSEPASAVADGERRYSARVIHLLVQREVELLAHAIKDIGPGVSPHQYVVDYAKQLRSCDAGSDCPVVEFLNAAQRELEGGGDG